MILPIEIFVYEIFPRCELRVIYQVNQEWNSFVRAMYPSQLLNEFISPGDSFLSFKNKYGQILLSTQGYYHAGKMGGMKIYNESNLVLSECELRYAKIWFMRGAIQQNDMTSIENMKEIHYLAPFFVYDALNCGNYHIFDYFKKKGIKCDDNYFGQLRRTETAKIINTLICRKFGAPCCLNWCRCRKVNFRPKLTNFFGHVLSKNEMNTLLLNLIQKKQIDTLIHFAQRASIENDAELITLVDASMVTEDLINFVTHSKLFVNNALVCKGCQMAYQGKEDLLRLIISISLKTQNGHICMKRYLELFHFHNVKKLIKIFSEFVTVDGKSNIFDMANIYCSSLLNQEQQLKNVPCSIILQFDCVHYFRQVKHQTQKLTKLLNYKSFKIILYLIETNKISIKDTLEMLRYHHDYPDFLMDIIKTHPSEKNNLARFGWKRRCQLLIDILFNHIIS